MARIRLTVSPGAKRSEIVGRHGDDWKARVAAAPERGRANDALRELLADVLGVPRGAVHVVSGHGSRRKVVEADGVTESAAVQRLQSAARDRS